MQCTIRNLSFTYPGGWEPVFESACVEWDSAWRLGLSGRNGRGKTTLLKLMLGAYPYQGVINLPLTPVYFPFSIRDEAQPTLQALREAAPDAPEWRLLRETNLLALRSDVLDRPFQTLSKGEQTKALLCALFAREDAYPLIDEPTNHLDLQGRELTAEYLRAKDGFLLVSHDRAFLNRCTDHTLAINKAGLEVIRGNYDVWREQFECRNAYEQARNEDLRRDIARLSESARRAAAWSDRVEKTKYHVPESSVAALDRGYVGARSAAMMKRSLNTLKRRERAVEEKSALLQNVERVGELKLNPLRHPKRTLVTVEDGAVRYGERVICDHIRFSVSGGERVALTGANGCGKSSVLKTLCGLSDALRGKLGLASGLIVSYVPQETDSLAGDLRAFVARRQLDETLLKAILRNMDFSREPFDRDLRSLSQGQKKKILLAASLCVPAHLYVWDEPLNYIDVLSREQVEALILTYQPTLLVVEHDRTFLQRVCTGEIRLGGDPSPGSKPPT